MTTISHFTAYATAAASSITVIGAALAYTATPGHAQEFNGSCTAIKEQAACAASQWCHWSTAKPVTLPNGQVFTPKSFCGFKRGFKAGWTAQQQQVAQPATK